MATIVISYNTVLLELIMIRLFIPTDHILDISILITLHVVGQIVVLAVSRAIVVYDQSKHLMSCFENVAMLSTE